MPLKTNTDHHRDPIWDIPHLLGVFRSYIGARMYVIFALSVAAGLAEGVGIMMLLPLLQSLDGLGGGDASGVGAWIGRALDWLGLSGSTLAILLLIGGFFLLKGAFIFLARAYQVYLQAQLMRELKTRLYDAYSGMRLQYYVSKDTGHFINVIDGQMWKFLGTFNSIISLGKNIILITVFLAAAMVVSWQFGVVAIALGLLIFAAFRKLNIFLRTISRRHASEAGVQSELLIQALQSFKYLTATGLGSQVRGEVVASIKRMSRQILQIGLVQAFTEVIREPVVVSSVVIILIVHLVWLQQPLAPILVSILLFYRALGGMLGLQSSWQGVLSSVGGAEMVRDEFANQAREREPDGSQKIGPLTTGVELRDVRFAYSPEQGDVLSGVSLFIPARTSIALIGESGSGKSTLVDVLTLMLKPRQGHVLIDGVPGDTIKLSSWRQQIGFVSQETVVFNDTIANNISLWEGDINQDSLLFERVREAARQAHIAHVIEALPEGYNTAVGEHGVRLSGGQRQRLFIARELYKHPNLLILDEATSALDSESERAIQESIDTLKGRITVVIIAHRLATIRNVDKVFVIDKGKVVEEGSYDTLRDDRRTRFSRLVAMQKL
jgi:ABC-type multidrug transport system fused ATPase/permease subunit